MQKKMHICLVITTNNKNAKKDAYLFGYMQKNV